MEDSALSIIASITGILTFFAAIMGFVYVRYRILQNGTMEMMSVIETATALMNDSQEWLQTVTADVDQRGPHFEMQKNLRRDLCRTEFQIFKECYSAHLITSSAGVQWAATLGSTLWGNVWHELDPETWDQFQRMVQPDRSESFRTLMDMLEALQRQYNMQRQYGNQYLGLGWRLLANLGASPLLLRWYTVREKVLEKVRTREIIRSRLSFHQISTANWAVQILLRENDVLRAELGELKDLVLQALSPTVPVGETQHHVPASAQDTR